MITFAQVPSWYWHGLGVTKFCTNVRDNLMPNLWALWGSEISAFVIFVSSQCIAFRTFLSSVFYLYIGGLCKHFSSHTPSAMGESY